MVKCTHDLMMFTLSKICQTHAIQPSGKTVVMHEMNAIEIRRFFLYRFLQNGQQCKELEGTVGSAEQW